MFPFVDLVLTNMAKMHSRTPYVTRWNGLGNMQDMQLHFIRSISSCYLFSWHDTQLGPEKQQAKLQQKGKLYVYIK